MKKLCIALTLMLISVLIFTPKIHADMGPKPTIALEITSYKQERFYVELIVKTKRDITFEFDDYEYRNTEFKVLADILKTYDKAGYKSATLTKGAPFFTKYDKSIENTHFYNFGYYAPSEFKILIYDKENNIIYTTNHIDVKAFNSRIKVDMSNIIAKLENTIVFSDEVIEVAEVHDVKSMITTFIFRLLITLAIEILIMLLLGYRLKKSFLIVIVTNVITQLGLTIFLFISLYFYGSLAYMFAFILGEIIVLIVESLIYAVLLKEKSKLRAVSNALLANVISALTTFIK